MLRLCANWTRPPALACKHLIRPVLQHPYFQIGQDSCRSSSFLLEQGSCKGRIRMSSNDASQKVSVQRLPSARIIYHDIKNQPEACSVLSFQTDEVFYFGKFKIDPTEVFLITEHSYGFVNLKPVVPGHVLVSPRRVVHRFLDLTPEETADLWVTAKRIGEKIEPFYKATSLTFAIQDGPQAGQTVPHVHVHILPRKGGDFENNDEIYDVIDEKEKQLTEKLNLDKERKDRTFEDMAAEAAQLRALF